MSDWGFQTETWEGPDGSMDVAYCPECDYTLSIETAENADSCPSCGWSKEGDDA
jgi:rubrerythrin